MQASDRQLLLEGALDIAEDLHKKIHVTPHGWYWETLSIGDGRKVAYNAGHSVYSGTAGVALFFFELSKQHNDPRWLKAAHEGARWVAHFLLQEQEDTYYALITGRLGSALALHEIGTYTKDQQLVDAAIKIGKGAGGFLNMPGAVDDLINGYAGTMMGLVKLYHLSGEKELLDLAYRYVEKMLGNATLNPGGIYWDRGDKHIKGLCGYSHGASGIGIAWLELANYFGNDSYKWLAEACFHYENNQYDEESNNWPDFRKGIYDEQSRKEYTDHYRNKNFGFFHRTGDMAAWCHGAPGIGLARVRAHELTGEEAYRFDLDKALSKTRTVFAEHNSPFQSYTLCHGKGGNAMLFLEVFKQNKDPELLEEAFAIAKEGILKRKEGNTYVSGFSMAADNQEDNSLFMGNAGIGYYYLMVREPLQVPSILSWHLGDARYEGDTHAIQTVGKEEVFQKVANKLFARTLTMWSAVSTGSASMFDGFAPEQARIAERIIGHISEQVASCDNEQVKDVFALELAAAEMDLKIDNTSFVSLHHMLTLQDNQALLNELPDPALRLKKISLPADYQLLETQWDWSSENEDITSNLQAEADEYQLLLTPSAFGTLEHPLNQFSFLVLELFKEGAVFEQVVPTILEYFDASNEDERQQVVMASLQQVKEAIHSGFLLVE